MNTCTEKFLEDIVRIDYYMASNVTLPLPQNVPGITTMTNVTLGTRLLSLAINGDGDADISDHPTVKLSQKREAVGMVSSLDIDATVEDGMDAIIPIINKVLNRDVIPVLYTADEKQFLFSALYNTSSLTAEEQYGKEHTGKVKYSAKALSGLIAFTTTT